MEVDEGCSIRFPVQGYIGQSFLLWCFLIPSPQDVSVMSHGGAQRNNSKFPSFNKWHWWNCAPMAVVLVLVYCQILLWAHSIKGSFIYIYSLYGRWQNFFAQKTLFKLKQRMWIPPTPRKRALESCTWRKIDIQPIHWIFMDWVFSDMLANGTEVLVVFDLWYWL